MTSKQPRINQSGFVTVEQDKVLAIAPDGHLDESIAALADAGVDLEGVDVLQGEWTSLSGTPLHQRARG